MTIAVHTSAPTTNWWERAACFGENPAWWHTPHAGRAGRQQVADARKGLAICAACPVAAACHLDAVASRPVGVIRAGVAYDQAGKPARNCRHCDSPAVGRTSGAEYCSDNCQNRAAKIRAIHKHRTRPSASVPVPVRPLGVRSAASLLPLLTPAVVRGFWAKVRKGDPRECWPWTGEVSHRGQGRYVVAGAGTNRMRAMTHRIAWTLAHRREIGPLMVKATCGGRLCCNPAHLVRNGDTLDVAA